MSTLNKLLLYFFFIWVLRPFQEYFTYIEPIFHQRRAKTREPGEKSPDHPQADFSFPTGSNHSSEKPNGLRVNSLTH